jgi:glycine/D-amino acid oxidase-like deaminating enzyme
MGARGPLAARLAPVRVSPDRVIRQVVGLRPFRRSGFNVSVGRVGDVVVVHNYGHGGGGISLSWGTAVMAVEQALSTPHRAAAVIGAGVVGLSTARCLLEHGFRVTIYAADFPPATTSNAAGASWGPFSVFDPGRAPAGFNDQFRRAARLSHEYFERLVGPRYGVSWRQNYYLSDGRPEGFAVPSEEDRLVDDIRPAVEVLASHEHPFGGLAVSRRPTLFIEPAIYLAALLEDVRSAGGLVVGRRFATAAELASLGVPLVINCAGLGAGALFDDRDVLPIKGQLVVLQPQPEVNYLTIGPGDLYMMPRADGVVLGGTHERDVWSLDPNPVEAERILNGHRRLFNEPLPGR